MQPLQHFWLVAGQVVTTDTKAVEREKSLNTLVVTDTAFFTRQDLGRAQNAMMHRFVATTVQVKGAQITNVHIQSISALGEQTKEQFHAGFEAEKVDEAQPTQGLN